MELTMIFPDRMPSYETFLNDLASKCADYILARQKEPKFISQRKAFEIFGRDNVLRWRRGGKIEPVKRPGKLEYEFAALRRLQETKQDYL
jgi:hypothetical protein